MGKSPSRKNIWSWKGVTLVEIKNNRDALIPKRPLLKGIREKRMWGGQSAPLGRT